MQDVNHGAWIYNTLDKMPSHIILVAVLRFLTKVAVDRMKGALTRANNIEIFDFLENIITKVGGPS